MNLDRFREVVLADFEFIPRDGEPLGRVVCCVAHLLKSGKKLRLWEDELGPEPPYPIGPDVLFVAYNAVAEIGCHLALGWPAPARVLDLYVEYIASTNAFRPKGTKPPAANLISALTHFGLDTIGATEKRDTIDLVLSGGPWTNQQRKDILNYCESDVEALKRLLPAMLPSVDLPRALLRGRYMAAVARMERTGIPIDGHSLDRLRQHWKAIQRRLIAEDDPFGVYDEDGSLRGERFRQVLAEHDIAWITHADGTLDMTKEAFRDMSETFGVSAIAPLCRLRNALSGTRLGIGLTVGTDNRNRTTLWPFRSTTGRNQPSNARYIFGCARWLRGLIRPPPGWALAYLDWKQQEFGIAAALSGDDVMMQAYATGDPYLAFAKQAGLVPEEATTKTHKQQRNLCKACVLATQYGQGAKSLAVRIARPGAPSDMIARQLLATHRHTYRKFWDWSETFCDTALWRKQARTVFGWPAIVGHDYNPRSLANFPMQANGAEMMRIACCLATERGIEVCAPVHDAVLIAAALDRIEVDVSAMRACMIEASRAVLDGFAIGVEVDGADGDKDGIIRYPDRYMDGRNGSREMWDRIWAMVYELEEKAA